MCGIVGILSKSQAPDQLVDGLRRLEYRGYDSAGIATIAADGSIQRVRSVGKIGNLDKTLRETPIEGTCGIGHTRWATHGGVEEKNAHPHYAAPVAVVHNGIIENFAALRAELETAGCQFISDTDTEVIAHLIATTMAKTQKDIVDVFPLVLEKLEGAFAIAIIIAGNDDLILAARRGPPLAIGRGEGEMFVGSDAFALAPFTNKVTYLEDHDWAVIKRDGFSIRNTAIGLEDVFRQETISQATQLLTNKDGHRHFMAKEIHEQPEVISHTLAHYIDLPNQCTALSTSLDFSKISRLTISACGTAFYAGHIARYWFEELAKLPVDLDIASELRYRHVPYSDNGAAIFISQSGETADTLAALREAKAKHQQTLAVVNTVESTIAREADHVFPIVAGPEIGVASTKAFTCQLTTLACLAIAAARARGTISAEQEQSLIKELLSLPRLMSETLKQAPAIEEIAELIAKKDTVIYMGRGVSYPLALEGALKLKEISYIHAEGFAAGELKHGTIALIEDGIPVVVIAPDDEHFEKTISNMHEVIARRADSIMITQPRPGGIDDQVSHKIIVPPCSSLLSPMVNAIPIQLLAYFTAVAKGTDVDQPRNLAKSVTVE